jgi:hypothetical protein
MMLAAVLAAAATAAAPPPGTWTAITPKDAAVSLTYAPAGAPGPVLTMVCERGTGQIVFNVVLASPPDGWPAGRDSIPLSVILTSGAQSATLRGLAQPIAGGVRLSSEVATRAPVIDAFGDTGLIAISTKTQLAVAPTPAPRGTARKFLGPCK